MGITEMVQDSLGYVTPQDRQEWKARRADIEEEKNSGRSGVGKVMLNSVSQSLMSYGDMAVRSQMHGEQMKASQERKGKIRRVIEETTETVAEYDKDGNEMEVN